jgi:primase-polymerase (primpol)-like protein
MPSGNVNNIPPELKARRQFVNWGIELGGGDNNPKRPYCPLNRQPYGWTDPANWGTFDEAFKNVLDGWALGVGFVFSGVGVVGVDLDNCFIDKKLIPEAESIVNGLHGAFMERSVSGKGLHIYVLAPSVDLGITKTSFDFPGYPPEENRHVEIYKSGAYFAMTGRRFI